MINQFYRKPFNFFNEHDFHQYCYHVFYSKKQFSKQFTTLDGKKTNLLHPEYPTIKRFKRKEIILDEAGRRAWYDMVILNPNFIKNNTLKTVSNKDYRFASGKPGDLIAAMEFKFITKHGKKFQNEINFDFFKLSNAQVANLKYMLVFSNTIGDEIDYFKSIPKKKDIKIIYTKVYEENNMGASSDSIHLMDLTSDTFGTSKGVRKKSGSIFFIVRHPVIIPTRIN